MAAKEKKRVTNKIKHQYQNIQEALVELGEMDRQHCALNIDYGLRVEELDAMHKLVDTAMRRVMIGE